MALAPRTCAQCNQHFEPTYPAQRFCGNTCAGTARHAAGSETRECARCGTPFTVQRHRTQRFCSRECRPGGWRVDLTGQVFDRLTVIGPDPNPSPKGVRRRWICQCICGNTTSVGTAQLRDGSTRSCGCYSNDRFRSMITKHGKHESPEYGVWKDMRKRCTNPYSRRYADYGGRGITVDPCWDDFATFLADMGPRPSPQHTIDRIDNDLGYSKSNCRWAMHGEQMLHTRRSRPPITYQERTQPLMGWAKELGISYFVLHTRLYELGWDVSRAFTTPVQKRKK